MKFSVSTFYLVRYDQKHRVGCHVLLLVVVIVIITVVAVVVDHLQADPRAQPGEKFARGQRGSQRPLSVHC